MSAGKGVGFASAAFDSRATRLVRSCQIRSTWARLRPKPGDHATELHASGWYFRARGILSNPYDDGRSGRQADSNWDGFQRNDYQAGLNARRNWEMANERNQGAGGVYLGGSGKLTLRGCLGGIALLVVLPLVAYVAIGAGVVLYERFEKRSSSTRAVHAPPVCTQTSPPCGPDEMYKDPVTGSLHPHPPKTLADQLAWRAAEQRRAAAEASAAKRARKP